MHPEWTWPEALPAILAWAPSQPATLSSPSKAGAPEPDRAGERSRLKTQTKKKAQGLFVGNLPGRCPA